MQLELANGKKVEVSQEEIDEFITQVLIQNPYWKYSKLLTESEVMRYLKKESTRSDLMTIARYLLVYIENISFTGYVYDKSEGQLSMTKELNMPVIIKLRDIYRRINYTKRTPEELAGDVYEMENACREIGADPL